MSGLVYTPAIIGGLKDEDMVLIHDHPIRVSHLRDLPPETVVTLVSGLSQALVMLRKIEAKLNNLNGDTTHV